MAQVLATAAWDCPHPASVLEKGGAPLERFQRHTPYHSGVVWYEKELGSVHSMQMIRTYKALTDVHTHT